jgi:hypothetical protein
MYIYIYSLILSFIFIQNEECSCTKYTIAKEYKENLPKMSISTIFRTACQFYFNYHYSESTSLWIHSTFMRRVQFAIRAMLCFLIVGFLSYGTQLSHQFSLEYLIPVISILCLQQTFGSTLSGCYQITLVITPLSIFLFLVKKIGLGYHDYLATELLLLLTSFAIAYGCTQVDHLNYSFLYNRIFFRFKLKKFLYFIMLYISLRIFLNLVFHPHFHLKCLAFILLV